MRFTGIHTLRTSKGFKDSKYLVQSDWSLHPRSKMTKARKHNDCQKEDDEIAWFSVPCSKFVHYVYIYIHYVYHAYMYTIYIFLKGDSQHQSHAARAFLPRLVEPAPWGGAGQSCRNVYDDSDRSQRFYTACCVACCSKKYMKNQIDSNRMYISV